MHARHPPTLFSPFTLGALTLPNRIVMAPMTRTFASEHIPGDPDWPKKIRSGQLESIRAFHSDDLATL